MHKNIKFIFLLLFFLKFNLISNNIFDSLKKFFTSNSEQTTNNDPLEEIFTTTARILALGIPKSPLKVQINFFQKVLIPHSNEYVKRSRKMIEAYIEASGMTVESFEEFSNMPLFKLKNDKNKPYNIALDFFIIINTVHQSLTEKERKIALTVLNFFKSKSSTIQIEELENYIKNNQINWIKL